MKVVGHAALSGADTRQALHLLALQLWSKCKWTMCSCTAHMGLTLLSQPKAGCGRPSLPHNTRGRPYSPPAPATASFSSSLSTALLAGPPAPSAQRQTGARRCHAYSNSR